MSGLVVISVAVISHFATILVIFSARTTWNGIRLDTDTLRRGIGTLSTGTTTYEVTCWQSAAQCDIAPWIFTEHAITVSRQSLRTQDLRSHGDTELGSDWGVEGDTLFLSL